MIVLEVEKFRQVVSYMQVRRVLSAKFYEPTVLPLKDNQQGPCQG